MSGCVFDVGVSPAERYLAEHSDGTDPSADVGSANMTGSDAMTSGDNGVVGPPRQPLGPTVWPATFTQTLTGGGLILQPLGARRGFTGVLQTPDGALRLEALP